jgi:hypothetical protein
MITDVKGFTERTSSTSRDEMRKFLDSHEALLLPLVAKFQGTLIKGAGDSFMVTFDSPTNAVLCAIMMQEKLREHNEGVPETERINIRIAINAGEVELREGDIFGDAVNIAARIEGITDANEIYFTESVYLAMNKSEVPSSEVGERRLKGIPEAIKVYRVIQDPNSDKYQQLLAKLKNPKGLDIATSGLGMPILAVRPRKYAMIVVIGLALVAIILAAIGIVVVWPAMQVSRLAAEKAAVLEAAEKGDFSLAYARADKMVAEHPAEAVSHETLFAVAEAEVAALSKKGGYDQAERLIAQRAKERPNLNLDALEKKVMIEHAGKLIARGNYAGTSGIYKYLDDKYPRDKEVLQGEAKHLGADFEDGPTLGGIYAAYQLAEDSTGPLDDLVGRTLVAALEREGPFGEYVQKIRAVLHERYAPANDAVKLLLEKDNYEARVNAYYFLKEAGKLTPEQELRYHVKNFITLDNVYKQVTDDALKYLQEAVKAPDWEAKKKAANIGPTEDIIALHSRDDYSKEVVKVLRLGFMPEIKDALPKWAQSEVEDLKANAAELMKAAE